MSLLDAGRRTTNDGLVARLAALETRAEDVLRERRANREFRRRASPSGTPAADAPRHVVCVIVDALRADAVDRSSTPFLHSLSPAWAVSPSTWTVPAVTSLFTGRYPHQHGVMRQTDGYENAVTDMTPLPPRLDADAHTLSDRLAGAGYDTFGGFGMIVPFLALSGRFRTHRLLEGASAERLLSEYAAWLLDRRTERTFAYLHLSDLHEPVVPPREYRAAHGVDESIPGLPRWRHEDVPHGSPTVDRYRTHRRRLYDAAVAYVDDRLAAAHARLADLVDDLLLLVGGDHGEAFGEWAAFDATHFADPRPAYCVGHGGAPYEAVARVPLAIAASGTAAGTAPDDLDVRPSLVDVAPTVLDAVGLDVPSAPSTGEDGRAPSAGVSLLEPVTERRQLVVEGVRYGYEKKAIYRDGWKLLVSRGDDVAVGFSLPEEAQCELPDSVGASMLEALPPWPDGRRRDAVPRNVRRRLEDLGYA